MTADDSPAVKRNPYFHVRKEDVHQGSAIDRDPPFASFDVVLRRDYDALVAERDALQERAEAWQKWLTLEREAKDAAVAERDSARRKLEQAVEAVNATRSVLWEIDKAPVADLSIPLIKYRLFPLRVHLDRLAVELGESKP